MLAKQLAHGGLRCHLANARPARYQLLNRASHWLHHSSTHRPLVARPAAPKPLSSAAGSPERPSFLSLRKSHQAASAAPPPELEPYSPPTAGILSHLPKSWVPYGELIRLDKPTGTYYLFLPCLFSTLLAAPLATPMTPPLTVLGTSLLFFSGALIMRGAGCSINDLWDRNFDPHVARTRHRPIARGAITPFAALTFTGFQLLAGLGILLQFPLSCLYYGIPSLALVALYPLAKRVTYYPQAVLGLTFSWGAIMGFPALGIDLLASTPALTAAACLYGSNIAWTVLYDMIYAHMDIKDDQKAGIKSIALKHDAETKKVLSGLAVVQISLLAAAGTAAGAGPAFFVGSCGGAAVSLAWMIKRVNLKSVKDCWWWFVNGCWITGGVIAAGLGLDYAVRYLGEAESSQKLVAAPGEDDL
ncbi:UbiA prenyltransferase family-domain-containing protein [Microdochium bolleyi]|uniref:4-hydroxybenzoate polyprenyltransferase, mitochondrial n=1 Tax=Microdochium bolleyi TaxID=196109 RepID=A0A136JIP9_9PEZI|nr:UbiA prenyltransferase family-domain-containing protein [Microdochium bolleyi]